MSSKHRHPQPQHAYGRRGVVVPTLPLPLPLHRSSVRVTPGHHPAQNDKLQGLIIAIITRLPPPPPPPWETSQTQRCTVTGADSGSFLIGFGVRGFAAFRDLLLSLVDLVEPVGAISIGFRYQCGFGCPSFRWLVAERA